jgi:tetratricopeptide (TPR) repeat protein
MALNAERKTSQLVNGRRVTRRGGLTYYVGAAGVALVVLLAVIQSRSRLEADPGLAGVGTDNAEAHSLYLDGRYYWDKREPAALEKSKALFEEAIDLDPTYAQAWVGLADAWTALGSYFVVPPEDAHPRARAAAERALQINADLAEAHVSLASTLADHYWDWDGAALHFARAVELSPSYATAHLWYAELLERQARFEEMLVEALKAETLDPLAPVTLHVVGKALFYLERYDESIAQYQKIMRLHPQYEAALLHLGLAYLHAGQLDEAIAVWEPLAQQWQRPHNLVGLLGHVYARVGRIEDARAILVELDQRSADEGASSFHYAVVYIGLGEYEVALDHLEEAYEERIWLMGLLKAEPIFDPLRTSPRFDALLEKMGLAD